MKQNDPDYCLEDLSRVISYDPSTGEFTHLISRNSVRAGQRCGWIENHGYIRIKLFGRSTLAQRLAWFFVNGAWPVGFIDHIDGDRTNNRISNLREATAAQNSHNKRHIGGASGVVGVRFRKHLGTWQATISENGIRKSLGHFKTIDEAAKARRSGEVSCYGDFRAVAISSGGSNAQG